MLIFFYSQYIEFLAENVLINVCHETIIHQHLQKPISGINSVEFHTVVPITFLS